MARHRRHRRPEEAARMENNPPASGFDLASLAGIASLLNNIDINKITSLLGTFGNGNINSGNLNSEGINGGSLSTETLDSGAAVNRSGAQAAGSGDAVAADRRNELANALRVLINADKAELLQVALQFYVANKNNQSNINGNP
jgi:hypothetical protein